MIGEQLPEYLKIALEFYTWKGGKVADSPANN